MSNTNVPTGTFIYKSSPFLPAHSLPLPLPPGLEEFFEISSQSDQLYDYTVAWVDCGSQGSALGRGLFFRGNHVTEEEVPTNWHVSTRTLTMPMDFPSFALNKWTVATFNWMYYHKQSRKVIKSLVDYNPFFYPLDAVLQWNRMYGKRGFLQYQFVVSYEDHRIIRDILQVIAASGSSSFL
ncbi:hypothetical protein QUF50_09200, partial [Thiotrichales bacterium HSG1]|nr:hypothetical protein [Thiotrichales bacterium HSG1]